jgi:hypothetical protein
MPRPSTVLLYHLAHVDALGAIVAAGALPCEAAQVADGDPLPAGNGRNERRLRRAVPCHPGDRLGDYVSFSFCPRPVALAVAHRRSSGGQTPLVHLVLAWHDVAAWCTHQDVRWAFTTANAAAAYTDFFDDMDEFDRIDWDAVASNDLRRPAAKEAKQAEFLVRGRVPWSLVRGIGVMDAAIRARVEAIIADQPQPPRVVAQRDWYFP